MDNSTQWLPRVALLALCSTYLVAAFGNLANVHGLMAALRHAGVPAVGLATLVTLVSLTVAPALVLLFEGEKRRIGAWWLAGFTLLVAVTAHRFWLQPHGAHMAALQAFLGHLALAGAFLFVAESSSPTEG